MRNLILGLALLAVPAVPAAGSAEENVAAYLTISGTQAAEFLGIPSQGRSFRIKTIDIVGFANGKAVEHWGVTDTGMLMQQLAGDDAEAK